MVTIAMKYTGELHCEAVHGPSGTQLMTDAPKDNMGKGEHFSPTDLVATGLGTCILTTMAIVGKSFGVDISGATASVEKEMTPPPRRLGALRTRIIMPPGIPNEHRKKLESAAHHCPVHRSLHPDVEAPIEIVWS